MTFSTMYVCEHGAIIKKSGERILVARGGELLADFPIRTLKHLLVFGKIDEKGRRSFNPVELPLTASTVKKHLAGELTVGQYMVRSNQTVR